MSDYFACTRCGNRSEGYCFSCGASPEDTKSYCSIHLRWCEGKGHDILWGFPLELEELKRHMAALSMPIRALGVAMLQLGDAVENLKGSMISSLGFSIQVGCVNRWLRFTGFRMYLMTPQPGSTEGSGFGVSWWGWPNRDWKTD